MTDSPTPCNGAKAGGASEPATVLYLPRRWTRLNPAGEFCLVLGTATRRWAGQAAERAFTAGPARFPRSAPRLCRPSCIGNAEQALSPHYQLGADQRVLGFA